MTVAQVKALDEVVRMACTTLVEWFQTYDPHGADDVAALAAATWHVVDAARVASAMAATATPEAK